MDDIKIGVQAQEILKKPQRKKGKAAWILLVLLILASSAGVLFAANGFYLDLVMNGEKDMLLEYGEDYQEPGVEGILRGKWVNFLPENLQLRIETDLNQDALGKYTLTYEAEYLLWKASAQRTIRVVDTICPLITLKTSSQTVLPGQHYEEDGYIAVDNYDGNLTDQVQRVEKMGVVIYTVMDSSGNPASVEREIPYFDPLAPELLLEGGEEILISCGMIYQDPGFSASDNVDGDLTDAVAIEGEVIWYKPGVYPVVYTVADTFGNVTQKTRTVTVEAVPRPSVVVPNGKVIYLTFDDGPGPDTLRLLNLLKQYGVKATFFVTGSGSNGELWRIYKDGHSIGMHTMTHDYDSIYSSEEAFFKDLYGIQEVIYRNTGIRPTLMRFPGGGSNLISSFNEGIMTTLAEAVQDAGFQYFDWNVDSNDAGGALKKQTVVDNVIEGVQKQRTSIVLQHDIHSFSVDAVEDIILWGLEHGYQFLPLSPTSPPMHHAVLN